MKVSQTYFGHEAKEKLTDEEKLKVFEEHLKRIKSTPIKKFTEFAIARLPEYFWTLPASTTRLNHGAGETLLDRIMGCLYIARQVCDAQFKSHWTQRQKDQLVSALILHDGWRCGVEGDERRITQEMIDERGIDQDLLGNLKTTREHPEIGYRQLLLIVQEFNAMATKEKTKGIGAKDVSMILRAVRYHYGPWTEVRYKPFSLSWPYDSVIMQTHNIDFHQCHNMIYITRGNKDNG
jgi:hypothetical protein